MKRDDPQDQDLDSDDSNQARPTPEMPVAPDPKRVRELREQLNHDRSSQTTSKDLLTGRLGHKKKSARARDLGTYTLIPMLMLAGPAVGYVLGLLAQKQWGGEPWGAVVGLLVGTVAGFRQVFLLLAEMQKKNKKSDQ